MAEKIAPSVFLGKINESSDQQKQEYFSEIISFFKEYSDSYVLIIESTTECAEDEFILTHENGFQDKKSLELLESIILGFKTSRRILNTFSDTQY